MTERPVIVFYMESPKQPLWRRLLRWPLYDMFYVELQTDRPPPKLSDETWADWRGEMRLAYLAGLRTWDDEGVIH